MEHTTESSIFMYLHIIYCRIYFSKAILPWCIMWKFKNSLYIYPLLCFCYFICLWWRTLVLSVSTVLIIPEPQGGLEKGHNYQQSKAIRWHIQICFYYIVYFYLFCYTLLIVKTYIYTLEIVLSIMSSKSSR